MAESLNTPRLFTIARDLSEMEILADVDESDIGQIEVLHDVRFTVATYPDESFTGMVEAVYLQPEVVQDVVTYTVVVGTENRDGRLLPGMTATLDFVVAAADDVISLPAAALNLKMSDDMIAVLHKFREQRMAERGQSGGGRRSIAMIWYQDEGELKFMPVRSGFPMVFPRK